MSGMKFGLLCCCSNSCVCWRALACAVGQADVGAWSISLSDMGSCGSLCGSGSINSDITSRHSYCPGSLPCCMAGVVPCWSVLAASLVQLFWVASHVLVADGGRWYSACIEGNVSWGGVLQHTACSRTGLVATACESDVLQLWGLVEPVLVATSYWAGELQREVLLSLEL